MVYLNIKKGIIWGAISDYKKALKLEPDNYLIHYNMGLSIFKSEDYKGAVSAFNKSLEINPDYFLS